MENPIAPHWNGQLLHMINLLTPKEVSLQSVFIPPPNEVGGGVYWIHLVRPSVCPSVRLSVDDMVSGA